MVAELRMAGDLSTLNTCKRHAHFRKISLRTWNQSHILRCSTVQHGLFSTYISRGLTMVLRTAAALFLLSASCQGVCDTLIPGVYSASVSAGYIDYRSDSHQGSGSVAASLAYSLNSYSTFIGQATAGPNHLGASASIQVSADQSGYGAGQTYSVASLKDTLRVSGPSRGYLDIKVDVNGSIATSVAGNGDQSTDAELGLTLGFPEGACSDPAGDGCQQLVTGANDFLLPYLVDDSGDVTLLMDLLTIANCGTSRASGTNTCFAKVNYFDTAEIASITVTDADRNAIAGDFVTSLSGVNYSIVSPPPTPISATPEPSTFALLGTGVLCLASKLRRRLV